MKRCCPLPLPGAETELTPVTAGMGKYTESRLAAHTGSGEYSSELDLTLDIGSWWCGSGAAYLLMKCY